MSCNKREIKQDLLRIQERDRKVLSVNLFIDYIQMKIIIILHIIIWNEN